MNTKLFSPALCLFATAVLFAIPLPARAACSIINGQQYCDNSADPTQTASPAPQSGFGSQGLFNCSKEGAYSVSSAAMDAVGGSYVPVNDAAVTLTTGYLVYKECVLSAMVANMRKNATAQLIQESTGQFLTGRNGGPMFPANLNQNMLALSDTVVANDLANGTYDKLNPAFRDDVKRAVQRSYDLETKDPSATLACSYGGSPEQLNAVLHGQGTDGAADVLVLTDPNCIPLEAYNNAASLRASRTAAAQNEALTRLSWNNGVYDIIDGSGNVVTPGFIVAGMIQQQLGSAFRQQESATDINQILGYTFANISRQILNAGLSGLQGLVNRIGGQPAYLTQVVQETSRGLQDSALNTGLQVLVAAQQNETRYLAAWNAIAGASVNAATSLRAAEKGCWDLIVPKVQTYAATGDCGSGVSSASCTGPFGVRVATSTVFSQAAINSSPVLASASSTATEIVRSSAQLDALNQLLAGATNPASTTVQQAALRQIDTLVAGGTLRNQYQVQAAQQQAQNVQTSMSNFISDTVKHWGDDPLNAADPTSGWCNVNNPDVIKMWANQWRI